MIRPNLTLVTCCRDLPGQWREINTPLKEEAPWALISLSKHVKPTQKRNNPKCTQLKTLTPGRRHWVLTIQDYVLDFSLIKSRVFWEDLLKLLMERFFPPAHCPWRVFFPCVHCGERHTETELQELRPRQRRAPLRSSP